ncbi:putative periplasmic serine endoprotease DegP-like precursor [compost metagenome]
MLSCYLYLLSGVRFSSLNQFLVNYPLKMFFKKIFSFCCCLLIYLQGFGQEIRNAEQIEKLTSRVVESTLSSCVQIAAYDTVRKRASTAVFSGVVVSAEGHILTVAHTTKPNQIYQIHFPDGKKHLAIGLGRISIRNDSTDLDLAMIKLNGFESWSFTKMGQSAGLKANQPCVGISYPGTFEKNMPNIRFGRLTNPKSKAGYIESTCKMEPGDSGGPLFNLNGEVIAIHSWIANGIDENFEIPVDLYKKYWSALNSAIDYKEVPKADNATVSHLSSTVNTLLIPITDELASFPYHLKGSSVLVTSNMEGHPQMIQGTVISYKSDQKRSIFIISKNSMVAENPVVQQNGKMFPVDVIWKDRDNDLVLLRPSIRLKNGIELQKQSSSVELTQKDLGKILVSSTSHDNKRVGVLSSTYIEMPLRFSRGYFGANATFINKKIVITQLASGSPAASVLKLDDQVTDINGVSIDQPIDYGSELMKYCAGDSITVDIVRSGIPARFKIFLPPYPRQIKEAKQFGEVRSFRSDAFKKVLVWDADEKVEECGAPVFDTKGEFYGINIARHSRTSSIIMPVNFIIKLLENGIQNIEKQN